MIYPAAIDTPAVPRPEATPRVAVLIDFCRERRERGHKTRYADTFEIVAPESGRAVSEWRMDRGLTISECARAARVSAQDWTRVECPSRNRIGRAFTVWAVLTWVMTQGGPKFQLSGPEPGDVP